MLFVLPEPPTALVWIEQPSATDIQRAQGFEGRGAAQPGRAAMVCFVKADGRLDACKAAVAGDTGLAEALLSLSDKYRLDRTRYAAPTVTVSVVFPKAYDKPPVLASHPSADQLGAGGGGMVQLNCTVTEVGATADCAVAKLPKHDPAAEAAALRAAPLYRFTPAQLGGRPTAAFASFAVDFSGGYVERPTWLRKPDGADMARAYPQAAARSGLSGRATLACRVTTSGTVADCRVIAESPPATGFGEAALQLAPKFQMKPQVQNGVAVDGKVVVPIIFRNTSPAPPLTTPTVKLLTWAPFLSAPTREQMAFVVPQRARERKASGHAAFRCEVRSDGGLRDCLTLGVDDPEGFDPAARRLVPLFKVDLGPNLPAHRSEPLYLSLAFDFSPQRLEAGSERYLHGVDWVRNFAADEVVSAYPPQAVAAGALSGGATVDCRIGATGVLEGCAVVGEQPAALGFGDAAVKVASVMQANLWTRNGEPAVGAKVRLPLKFIYSPDEKPK